MNILTFSIFLVLLISTLNFANGGDVPALIWSPTRSMDDLPQVFAGKKIDANNFHSKFLVPLAKGSRAFIVFLQDKFGLDYFSRFADIYNKDSAGGALKNVKHFMEDQFSTNLPSVREPMSAIDNLRKTFHNDLVEIHEPSKLQIMDIKKDKPQLILVHLPDLAGKKNEEATIRNNDELIAEMLKTLKNRGLDYAAMLTGEQAPHEEKDSNYLGRHLLQVEPKTNNTNITGIYVDFPNCAFYASKIMFSIKTGENATIYNMTTVTNKTATCSNATSLMGFTLVSENQQLTATCNLNFTISKRNGWDLKGFNIDYTVKGQAANSVALLVSDVAAPNGFSYHCTAPPLLKSNVTEATSVVMARLENIQLQPFNAVNGTFSTVWDCTGFFTIGIWMGLFSTLILALIIAFGLYMIMDIKTMDRFDDPKAKAFTVTAVDG